MKYLEKIERLLVLSLLVMMVSVVILSTVELGWVIINRVLKNYFGVTSMKRTSLQDALQDEISGLSISGPPLAKAILNLSKRFSAAC